MNMETQKPTTRLTGHKPFRLIAQQNIQNFDKLAKKAMGHYTRMEELLPGPENPLGSTDEYLRLLHEHWIPTLDARDQAHAIAVVFTAMYFEAFIYDYAAVCLGDSYTKAHLDKLDFVSKWVVIPQLLTGKEIDKSGQAYQSLKKLNSDRNALVHHKSRKIDPLQDAASEFLDEYDEGVHKSVQNCRNAFKFVIQELMTIVPDNHLKYLDIEPPK